MRPRLTGIGAAMAVALAACGGNASDDLGSEVVENYADVVHESYQVSLESAAAMDETVDAFIADPTDETLAAAKEAWLAARTTTGPPRPFVSMAVQSTTKRMVSRDS